MTTGERIADLRRRRGMTQPMLADRMDVSQSTVTSWENDRRNISNEDLVKLMTLFHVSADYILTGEKKETDRKIGLNFATHVIAVYGEIQAGVANWAEQNIIGQIKIDEDLAIRYGNENIFALRVKGESMNKRVINGDIAIFAKDQEISSGDVVAVLIDGQDATIKRYRETSLAIIFEPDSWDDSFKPYVFPKDGERDYRVLGKYLYHTSESI